MNYSPKPQPPKLAEWLLRLSLFGHKDTKSMLGDMAEEFGGQLSSRGPLVASWYYWGVVFGVSSKVAVSLPYRIVVLLSELLSLAATTMKHRALGTLKTDLAQEPPEAPIIGRFLLKALVPRERRKEAYGDATAEFPLNWKEFGKWGAYSLFWQQVISECSLSRWLRWLFWSVIVRHLSDFFHKYVG